MPNKDEIAQALSTLTDRTITPKGDSIWITCPWHGGGGEKTPSLKITVDSGSYAPGGWVCFGCSPRRSGDWNKIAVKLGLRKKGDDEDSPYAAEISNTVKSKLLGDEDDNPLDSLHRMIAKEPIIQKSQPWRGIKGWLLNDLGARVSMMNSAGIMTEYTRVYLPAHVNGKWKGGIFCSWTDKSQLKYENEKHVGQEILFPYDYVKNKLLEVPPRERKLVLVEGPRDALNLLQNDIMALANLGGETVWSDEKAELLMDLDVAVLVIATDPDKVGNGLANTIKRQLSNTIGRILRFKMQVKYSEKGRLIMKEDPGSLSYERMQYLKKQMEGF